MRRTLLAVYRVRGLMYAAAAAILIGNVVLGWFAPDLLPRELRRALAFCALGLTPACLLLATLGARLLPSHESVLLASPVRGRWLALNSPATRVPSHGIRMYGQAYAIDLVCDPSDRPRPEFGGSVFRRNQEYPAWSEPVTAMADGIVVAAHDRKRDHRARSNTLGLIVMMAEGALREVGGPSFIVGNHVTIRTDDGLFVLVAHLQRGSVRVAVGDRVSAGDTIGQCGNSGNSSEPHVHAQLMDRRSLWTAQGMPFRFRRIHLDDAAEPSDAVPADGQHMAAAPLSL